MSVFCGVGDFVCVRDVACSVFVSVSASASVSASLSVSVSMWSQGHFEYEDQAALVLTYLRHDAPKLLLKQFSKHDIRHFMRHLLVALEQVSQGLGFRV